MNWTISQEERERLSAEKSELRKMAREDFARAKKSKDEDEKETLVRDGYRRLEIAKSKG